VIDAPLRQNIGGFEPSVCVNELAETLVREGHMIDCRQKAGPSEQAGHIRDRDTVVFLIVGEEGDLIVGENRLGFEYRLVPLHHRVVATGAHHRVGESDWCDPAALAGRLGKCFRRDHLSLSFGVCVG